jgi:hypothetical protein
MTESSPDSTEEAMVSCNLTDEAWGRLPATVQERLVWAVRCWGALDALVTDLEETHRDEIGNDHFGDEPESCSYCADIHAARDLLG